MPIKDIPYSRDELFYEGPQRAFTGRELDEIAFPIGGIGTGTVSLGGWGQLRDWEIMNRPAKGKSIPNAFFTLRVETRKKMPLVKVLQGPAGGTYRDGGHSAHRQAGEGLPHFRNVQFTGEYPLATVALTDDDFPVKATLKAFNPFIPLNAKDSGIPAAVLIYTLENTANTKVKASVVGNLTNIIGPAEHRINRRQSDSGRTGMVLTTGGLDKDHPDFGTMSLCCLGESGWVWPHWHDDRLLKFWEAVAWSDQWPPDKEGESDTGSVGAEVEIKAGETAAIPFIISWHFPNYEHWHKPEDAEHGTTWKNWYATQWDDAWDAASYLHDNFDRLHERTQTYHDTLFTSTFPAHVLDAISSQICTLRTNTCLRLTDGTFYGFEGCSDTEGCCEGSCTHVWNYAQALPYLFPKLQQSQREAEWKNSMQDDGFVAFRMPLPLGTKAGTDFHPAADGQMGSVIQVYREWLICGDDEWLKDIWPKAKKALEFAWKYWDADKDGIIEGLQHNTYDNEFFGPNTMIGSLYLAALRAAEEIAKYLGEQQKADEYRRLFESGREFSNDELFNGAFFEQIVKPDAHEPWPDNLRQMAEDRGRDDRFTDWPKWQFGKGNLSDQLLGQWYAEMLGLGYLYQRGNVRRTLRSIFRYNWNTDMTEHASTLRIYAINDEAGLVIATWPRGGRPGYPFWFCDEVWCGIEYQVAGHLIHENFIEEGLAIVKGVRDRYDGTRRNPWDEFECGHHYVRSMASFGLLLALSGFSYSAPEKRIGINPRIHEDEFQTFFSVASGWGSYSQQISEEKAELTIRIEYGSLTLKQIDTAFKGFCSVTPKIGNRQFDAKLETHGSDMTVVLDEPVTIEAGRQLRVHFR